jgi:hypothetical protein
LKTIVFGFFSLLVSISQASAFCSKPDAPYCASSFGSFDDQYEFDRCKREMESYKDDVESFLRCQNLKIEQIRSERQRAIDDYNEAVESFNRRARS